MKKIAKRKRTDLEKEYYRLRNNALRKIGRYQKKYNNGDFSIMKMPPMPEIPKTITQGSVNRIRKFNETLADKTLIAGPDKVRDVRHQQNVERLERYTKGIVVPVEDLPFMSWEDMKTNIPDLTNTDRDSSEAFFVINGCFAHTPNGLNLPRYRHFHDGDDISKDEFCEAVVESGYLKPENFDTLQDEVLYEKGLFVYAKAYYKFGRGYKKWYKEYEEELQKMKDPDYFISDEEQLLINEIFEDDVVGDDSWWD